MLKSIFFVAIGGAIGSALRYVTSLFVAKYWNGSFPLGTFVVNIIGCLLIGVLTGYFYKNIQENDSLKFLLVTGFCGGFTTFSAFALENQLLVSNNQILTALLYTIFSVVVGITAVYFGFWITNRP